MTQQKLLIVSPAFHGYYEAFRNAFDAVGYHTSVVLYDHFPSVTAKTFNKLWCELPELVQVDRSAARARASSKPVLEALKNLKPELVIVIKGDTLSSEWWDALESSKTPFVVWIYDEMRRMRYSDERLMSFEKIATYSQQDHAALARRGKNTVHIANGFDASLRYREIGHRREVTFVGARYPNRASAMSALHEAGEQVRVYGREWSQDFRDRARTWFSQRPDLPWARDVSRADAYGIMQGSLANVNVHFNQDGFAMRTFEVPGVGGVQLIDRPDVQQHYEVGTEVLVWQSHDELVDLARKVRRDHAWANRLREAGKKRTLAQHTMVHRAQEMKKFIEL